MIKETKQKMNKKAKQILIISVIVLSVSIFIVLNTFPIIAWSDDGSLTQDVDGCGEFNTTNAIYTLNHSISSIGTCFNITANNITLDFKGYNITGNQTPDTNGVLIDNIANSCIKNGLISGYDYGLYIYYSNSTRVNNMSVKNSSWMGFYIYASDNSIFENISIENSASVNLFASFSKNDTFSNITSRDTPVSFSISNSEDMKFDRLNSLDTTTSGFTGSSLSNSIIDNSYFTNNGEGGTYDSGIRFVSSSNYNNITNTVIDNSNPFGIILVLGNQGNYFQNITIKNSTYHGILFHDIQNNYNTFVNLTVYDSGDSGIFLESQNDHNTFSNLNISYNGDGTLDYDINDLYEAGIYSEDVQNITISNSEIQGNEDVGIFLLDTSSSNVSSTNFSNNDDGLRLSGSNDNTFNDLNFISSSTVDTHLYNSNNNYFLDMSYNNMKLLISASLGNTFEGLLISGTPTLFSLQTSSTNNTFLNSTHNTSDETVDATSSLIRKWYYQTYVNDTNGNAISNAEVLVYNSSNDLTENWTTNSSGWINKESLIDYINNKGTKTYYSNYTLSVTSASNPPYFINGENFTRNVTSQLNFLNDILTITYDSIFPSINNLSITTTLGSQTITFDNNVTDTNLDSCKYSVFNSSGDIEGLYDNVSVSCIADDTMVTITYHGTYNLIIYGIDKAGNENSTTESFTTSASPSGGVGGGGAGEPEVIIIDPGTFCGDGICQSAEFGFPTGNDLGVQEDWFNCQQDCESFDLDALVFGLSTYCFDDDPSTICYWSQTFFAAIPITGDGISKVNINYLAKYCWDSDEATECFWGSSAGTYTFLGAVLLVFMLSTSKIKKIPGERKKGTLLNYYRVKLKGRKR